MNAPATRLTDAQVDALSAAMRGAARPASSVSLQNYRFSMDDSRVMGVLRARDHPQDPHQRHHLRPGPRRVERQQLSPPHRVVTTWNTPSEDIEQC